MWGSVSPTVIQDHSYLIRRNNIFYFPRRVPTDVCSRFQKDRMIVSMHTRSLPKAEWSADAQSDRLERYWHSIRLEIFHIRELGLSLVQEVEAGWISVSATNPNALATHIRLKDVGSDETFFQGAERAIGYLVEERLRELFIGWFAYLGNITQLGCYASISRVFPSSWTLRS